jgi:hypothetical protein
MPLVICNLTISASYKLEVRRQRAQGKMILQKVAAKSTVETLMDKIAA